MPPDVAEDPPAALPPALVARGERDEWFTADKMRHDLGRLAAGAVPARALVFDGGHEWGADFFPVAGEFLRAILAG